MHRSRLVLESDATSCDNPVEPNDEFEAQRITGRCLRECPVCHRGRMITIRVLPKVRSSTAIKDTS
jgi:hypothetical protein